MNTSTLKTVPIDQVQTSALNPRKTFVDASLKQLAESIKQVGILQPLVVRSLGKGKGYGLVAGERRLRAAKLAKLKEVPVSVQKLTDKEVEVIALVENDQREDVPLLEKIDGYAHAMETHDMKPTELAKQIGKSASTLRGLLRLRNLPEKSRAALTDGTISPSLAGLIAGRPTEELRQKVEDYVFSYGTAAIPSYREVKAWVERNLTIELKQAPFKQADRKLLPDAGSCKSCPKRVGNMDRGEVSGRADVCTDPVCYAAKVTAHNNQQFAEFAKQGYNTLPIDEFENLVTNWKHIPSGRTFIALGDPCFAILNPSGNSWRQIISPYLDQSHQYVTIPKFGPPIFLVEKSVAVTMARQACPPEPRKTPKSAPPPKTNEPPLVEVIEQQDRELFSLARSVYGKGRLTVKKDLGDMVTEEIYSRSAAILMNTLDFFVIDQAAKLYHDVEPDSEYWDSADPPNLNDLNSVELVNWLAAIEVAHNAFGDKAEPDMFQFWFAGHSQRGKK